MKRHHWVVVGMLGAGALSIFACVGSEPVVPAACAAPLTQCGSACTNTASDPSNCGACGTTCGAGQVCSAGACGLTCGTGLTKCGQACADTTSDPQHCGGCGTVCAAGTQCKSSACESVCATGLLLCSAFAGYDAGVPVSDAGDAATDAPSDAPIDVAQEAAVDAAPPPLTCVDPQTDDHNCGGCGNECSTSQICAGATCGNAKSCHDLLVHKGPLADGDYTIDPDGTGPIKPFSVFCYGMNTPSPVEYLELQHSALTGEVNSNDIVIGGGGACPCPTIIFQFTRVRINIATLTIIPSDHTFAFARDTSPASCWSGLGGACHGFYIGEQYGSAVDCAGGGSTSGGANVDLRGTGFTIDPSVAWVVNGFNPGGSSAFNTARDVLNASGGGFCGGNTPTVVTDAGNLDEIVLKQN